MPLVVVVVVVVGLWEFRGRQVSQPSYYTILGTFSIFIFFALSI
jgi:hypothetical protein